MSEYENMYDVIELWCEPWCEFCFDDSSEKEQIHVDEFIGNTKSAELELKPKLKVKPKLEVKPNNERFAEVSKPETKVTCDHVQQVKSKTDFSEIIQEIELTLAPEIPVSGSNHIHSSEINEILDVVISMS